MVDPRKKRPDKFRQPAKLRFDTDFRQPSGLACWRFPAACCRLGMVLVCLLSACDRTAEIVNREASTTPSQANFARGILDECVAAYSKLGSYEDQAFVLLRYSLDGQAHTDRAPLSIAWEPSGQLGLRVYSVAAGPSDGRWRLRLNNEGQSVAGQVLSRSMPKRLDFDWLLSDPQVAQHLAAGLAGFPPQLDLLMGPEPLSGLLHEQAVVSSEPHVVIDGRACHTVTVTRSAATYRLLIDQTTMLLRRLCLPDANLPSEMIDDPRVSDIALTIEFDGVSTNRPIDFQKFRVDVEPDELLVNHFVPAPPLLETNDLGKRMPGFYLNDHQGNEIYNTASVNRTIKATVLMWLADHPACRLAAQQLAEAARTIAASPDLHGQVEFVSIWAESAPPAGQSFSTLAASWQLPGKLALDRDAMGRDLFGVQEAPTLVVLDDTNRLHFRESRANPALSQILPNLLQRLVGGENLGANLLQEDGELVARYQAALRIAKSVDATRMDARDRQAPMLGNYSPLLVELKESGRRKNSGQVVCAAVDSAQQTWLLNSNGLLTVHGGLEGEEPRTIQSPWSATAGSMLSVSPQAEFIAMYRVPGDASRLANVATGGEQIEVLETRTGINQTMHLGSGAATTDLQWLTLSGDKSPRLAVITSDRRTLLLDPRNREQLSGDCPSPPLAILPSNRQDTAIDGWIVLTDRSVQPLQLSAESAMQSLRTLGRAASHRVEQDQILEGSFPRLDFWPGRGPWVACTSPRSIDKVKETFTLARGWIARDEPAAFLLDGNLKVRWHARVALQPEQAALPLLSAATDPISGLATWAMADAEKTVYLMRSDGLTDHFRISDSLVGLNITARGERLLLQVVEPSETVVYDVRWK